MAKGYTRIERVCLGCSKSFTATNSGVEYCSMWCRFCSKVDKRAVKECWEWTGSLGTKGYGRIAGGAAHRMAWEFEYGPIPNGLIVCHACDNTRCVNPNHLMLGSHLANLTDRDRKNRQSKGEASGTAKLTENDVTEIRHLRTTGVLRQDLADRFGVSLSTIKKIISAKTWKHVVTSRNAIMKNKAHAERSGE